MQAFDLSGIDTTSAMVYFWTQTTEVDSQNLNYVGDNRFATSIKGDFQFGDSLYYQFSVNDLSAATITGRSDTYSMLLGFENFEFGLDAWDVQPEGWGLDDSRALSGIFSIHESPGAGITYPENADLSITLKESLDLSRLSEATLSLWTLYGFPPGDFGYVEASADGGQTWWPISEPLNGAVGKFYLAEFSLNDFSGPGNENVLLRFRVTSDASQAGPGWFIDDISILPQQTDVQLVQHDLPTEFELFENYPNPFNATTVIQYALAHEADVTLEVFNTTGQLVATLLNKKQNAGRHSLTWNGLDEQGHMLPSGLYFYRIQAGQFTQTGKMTMIK